MHLLVLFILFFQFVPSKGTKQIVRFAGETVTLSSEVKRVMSQVFWSINENTTYIASYEDGKVINWLPQYKGRLTLNTSTGDLTIHNLMKQDARVYKVEFHSGAELFQNMIELLVKEVLLPPKITVVISKTMNGWRLLVLHCSSMAEGVVFTWQANPLTEGAYQLESPGEIFFKYNITQGYANFTCIITRGSESTSSLYQDHSDDPPFPDDPPPEVKPTPAPTQRDHPVYYLILFLLGGLVAAILIYCKNKYDQHKRGGAGVSS